MGGGEGGAQLALEDGDRVLRIRGRGGRPPAARVAAGDLRGGAALVVAALGARGKSRIENGGYISRGYDRLDASLAALGAQMG